MALCLPESTKPVSSEDRQSLTDAGSVRTSSALSLLETVVFLLAEM